MLARRSKKCKNIFCPKSVDIKKTFFYATDIEKLIGACPSTHSGLQFDIRFMGSNSGLNMGLPC
jgi:hypothetical protein